MMRNIIYWVIGIIILVFIAYFLFFYQNELAVAPSPVPEIPEEEVSQESTYVNATEDMIKVELPFPGAVTGKEFSVIGEARGMWYFEGDFPVTVLDKDGQVLVEWYATAEGEWMTEEFVPFKGDIKVPETYIGPATLVLKRNNPSDLRENDASVSFPITIEY